MMPFFDDAPACAKLLGRLDDTLASVALSVDVLIVNDGSRTSVPTLPDASTFKSIVSVRELKLRRNLGHQRAIAVGLAHLESIDVTGAVVLMDADGDDDPGDIPRLLAEFERSGNKEIVFAQRTRRSEGLVFRTLYKVYQFMHRLLTGHSVRVGNFSVIPASAIRALVVVPELWNHYAAAVLVSKLPYREVPCPRGTRLAGTSKMNLVSLVTHGLSAISVFSDVVSVRLLIGTVLAAAAIAAWLSFVVLAQVASATLFTEFSTQTISMLLVILVQVVMFLLVLTFLVLASRKNASTVVARDYAVFVDELVPLYPGGSQTPTS